MGRIDEYGRDKWSRMAAADEKRVYENLVKSRYCFEERKV